MALPKLSTGALNIYADPLLGSEISPTTSPAASSKPEDSDPNYTLNYEEPVKANGAINVEFYTGVGKTMLEPEILEPYMDISSLEGKRVLIVDDVADSGKTLKLIMDLISEKGLSMGGDSAKVDARSATIYLKPTSIIKPEYVFKQTDKWINFPWSVLPPVTA